MAPLTAAILIALALTTSLYAIVLNRISNRYVPDWVWITVVVGNAMIGLGLWAIEAWSERLTFGLVVAANVAAGGPIIVWQLWQRERRRRERLEAARAAAHAGR